MQVTFFAIQYLYKFSFPVAERAFFYFLMQFFPAHFLFLFIFSSICLVSCVLLDCAAAISAYILVQNLFKCCGRAAVLARSRHMKCIDGNHTKARLRSLYTALAFSFLSLVGICAACNTRRHSSFRSSLSAPASTTHTCLLLESSLRFGQYNSGLVCF